MALPIVQKPLDITNTRDNKDPNQQRQVLEVEDVELANEFKRLNNSLEMLTKAMVGQKSSTEKIRNTNKNTDKTNNSSKKDETGFFNSLKEFSKGFAEGLLNNFGVDGKESKGPSKARKIETNVKEIIAPEKTKLDVPDTLEQKQVAPKEKQVAPKEKPEKFSSDLKKLIDINSKGFASLVKVTNLNTSVSRQGFKNLTGSFQTNLDTLKKIQKELKGLSLSNSKAFENVQKFAGSGGIETEGPSKAEERALLAKAIAEELSKLGIGGDAVNGLGIPGLDMLDIDGPNRNKTNPKDGKNTNQPKGKDAPKGGGPKTPSKGKGFLRGLAGGAATFLGLMAIDGNIGQDYPFPQEGPLQGSDFNPITNAPWTKAELAEYNRDPEEFISKDRTKPEESKLNPKTEKNSAPATVKSETDDQARLRLDREKEDREEARIEAKAAKLPTYTVKNPDGSITQKSSGTLKGGEPANVKPIPKVERSDKDKAEQLRLEKLFEKAREKGDSSSSVKPEKLSLNNNAEKQPLTSIPVAEAKNITQPKESATTLGMLKSSAENRQLQMQDEMKSQVAVAQPIVSNSTVNNTSQTLVPAKALPRNQNSSMERYLDNIRFA